MRLCTQRRRPTAQRAGPASLLIVLVILATTALPAIAQDAVWIGGPTGDWFAPSNWSTGVVPAESTDVVRIDAQAEQDTTVDWFDDESFSIANLTIDAGDRLQAASNASVYFSVQGDLALAGTLALDGRTNAGVGGVLGLARGGRVELGGTLSGTAWLGGGKLDNQGTVTGTGYVEFASLANTGEIGATAPHQIMQLQLSAAPRTAPVTWPSNSINEGWLGADKGTLLIFGNVNRATVLDNERPGRQGVIESRNDGVLELIGVHVVGGILRNSSDGETPGFFPDFSFSDSVLDGVRIEGEISVGSTSLGPGIARSTLVGEIDNYGVIKVGEGRTLQLGGRTSLQGSGVVQIDGGGVYAGSNNGGVYGAPVVQLAGHRIEGHGGMGVDDGALVNLGVVRAVEGTLGIGRSASSGEWATLVNRQGAKQGLLEAAAGSTLRLTRVLVQGGVVRAAEAPPDQPDATPGAVTLSEAWLQDVRVEGFVAGGLARLGGTIDNAGVLAGSFKVNGMVTLAGGGEVRLDQGGITANDPTRDNALPGESNFGLLVNLDNRIHGDGSFSVVGIDNRHVIEAVNGERLLLSTYESAVGFVNNGTLGASDAGVLQVEVVDNRGPVATGRVHAEEGGRIDVGYALGGVFATDGNGLIHANWIQGGRNEGTLGLGGAQFVNLSLAPTLVQSLENNGVMSVASDASVSVVQDFDLTGAGVWDDSLERIDLKVSGAAFQHHADHTIRGAGTIELSRSDFVNWGRIEAIGAGGLQIFANDESDLRQLGTIVVGSDLRESGSLQYLTDSPAFLNAGTVQIARRGYAGFRAKKSNGALEVINDAGATMVVDGTLGLSGSAGTRLHNRAGGTFSGAGLVRAASPTSGVAIVNDGLIELGAADSPGVLDVWGSVELSHTSELAVTLAGIAPEEFDALVIDDGQLLLGGGLSIELAAGYDPQPGDSFALLSAELGVSGTFAWSEAPLLSGRQWLLNYQPTSVTLSVAALTADFDQNGAVDGADLAILQAGYGIGAAAALAEGDATGDGAVSGADFLAWQAEHGQGLAMDAAASVAEPAAGMLAALVCGILGAVRQRARTHRRAT